LSDDIKLLSPWNKKHKILDLGSCNDSLDVITTKLPAMLSDLETCLMIVIRGNTTDKVMETTLIDILEEQATHPIILDFYNEIMKSENSYIIDNRKTKADNIHALDYVKNFLGDFYENTENENLKDVINNSCSLCIHFAQLFDIYFHIQEDQIDDFKYDADCFKALLDLPHSFVFNNSYDNVYELFHGFTINLMAKVYWKGANLEGNKTLETMYSSIEGRVNFDGFTALALTNREYQVFEFLIRADFEFPKNFLQDRRNNLSSNENVEDYIQKLNDFHKSILNGDVKKVKQFLSNNAHLTFARNLDNNSALKAAFDSNQMEVFSYLKSQGMNFASLQEYAEYCKAKKEFNDKKKVQLRQFNLKFLESAVELDVVIKMMQKSSFVYNHHLMDIKTVREAIKEVYEYIQTIVPELLHIAAASNELRVVFDFVNSDLSEFDPSSKNSLGNANSELDLIMLGAKFLLSEVETTRIFLLGTLSHELMHYVMIQVYENGLNPYGIRDFERKRIFEEIFNKYKEINHNSAIISSAYENYDDEYKHCELIARVLLILITYHNQTKLEEIKETYKDLFMFFDQYVLADMREYIPTMHTREKVRELNGWLDLVAEIESYQVKNKRKMKQEQTMRMMKMLTRMMKIKSMLKRSKLKNKKMKGNCQK